MIRLEQIHPNYICQLWPRLDSFIANGIKFSAGEYSIDQFKLMLIRGEQTLLAILSGEEIIGALTVWFANMGQRRVAFITSVSGKDLANREVLNALREWCSANGATHIQGMVRPSVARLCRKNLGFEQRYILVEQAL